MRTIKKVLVGQSGGPTAVINASLAGVIRQAHEHDLEVIGMRNGIEGFLEGRTANLTDLFHPARNHRTYGKQAIELLARTPSSFLGSCRYKLPDYEKDLPFYQHLAHSLASLDIDGILYIGGNDSMDTVEKISAYFAANHTDIPVIGVPKTIDNDLEGTDHTPGFGSAARYIATVVQELARDAEVYGKSSITIIETMGRDAGWLGAASSLAREKNEQAPDIILLPEVAFDEERLISKIGALFECKKSIIIVASEGVRRPDGSTLLAKSKVRMDAFGHLADQSGNALYLAELCQKHFDCKIRGINLNSLQRCAIHAASETDLREAWQLGAAGVEVLLAGKTACMVGLQRVSDTPYQTEIHCVAVAEIANKVKHVPADMISNDGCWVTEKALTYLRPLISNGNHEAESQEDGLPVFIPKLSQNNGF